VLLSQRFEWRENRARSTRPRDNHSVPKGSRLTGESKAHNLADALAFQPFKPVPGSASGVLGFARLVPWGEKVAPSPPCSTWNTSATGLEGGATRLPLISRG